MSRKPLTVLSIDDDPGDVELLRRQLEQLDEYTVGLVTAADANEAASLLTDQSIDIVFLDYRLGLQTGSQILERLREAGEIRPIIALTGQGDEYVVRELLSGGADDYLPKRDLCPGALRRSIEWTLGRFHQRKLEQLNKELLQELRDKNELLGQQNARLRELYETAHEFVDNVSHEFRTPLTVIKEFSSIILDGLAGECTEPQRNYLTTVLDRVDDLTTMVDDMLDLSKLEAGMLGLARRVGHMGEILNRVRSMLERKAKSNGVTLVWDAPPVLPDVYCDPEKISRVLINLAVNAIKFSEDGGRVTIWCASEPDSAQLRVGVTDRGPGIDTERVSDIFDRFKQLDANPRSSTKGFGLGLNIARELVHLNFGDIEVESRLGHGSTFTFTVPTADPSRYMERYLKRVGFVRNGSACVSLVGVDLPAELDPLTADEFELFIQAHIRKTDLLFRSTSSSWLLVLASNRTDSSALIGRLEEARCTANRNRPDRPFPIPIWERIGTWSAKGDRDQFMEAFNQRIAPTEGVCV